MSELPEIVAEAMKREGYSIYKEWAEADELDFEAADAVIAAIGQAGYVLVSGDDLRVVLDQRMLHSHSRPGVWNDDNVPGLAGTRCGECAARERLKSVLPVAAVVEPSTQEVGGG